MQTSSSITNENTKHKITGALEITCFYYYVPKRYLGLRVDTYFHNNIEKLEDMEESTDVRNKESIDDLNEIDIDLN